MSRGGSYFAAAQLLFLQRVEDACAHWGRVESPLPLSSLQRRCEMAPKCAQVKTGIWTELLVVRRWRRRQVERCSSPNRGGGVVHVVAYVSKDGLLGLCVKRR